MKFQGAIIQEQGVTFAIVIVKKHIVDNTIEANKIVNKFSTLSIFQNIPIILMAQDFNGVPSYYGRKDIVAFMVHIPLDAIPWKEYTLS